MLDHNEIQKQKVHLREQHRDKLSSTALEDFVTKLCTYYLIKPQPCWAIHEKDIDGRASIVRKWQIVNVVDTKVAMRFLFSEMLVSDYKNRGIFGDYVFTSLIEYFDIENGLVKTKNTLYCLDGEGEEVNATLLEFSKMRAIKQPLHMVRAIERDVGTIQDPTD
ncbi:hypothetical protein FEI13_05765 [Halomonas urmiana]|uniref:DUF6957 domain-containing protein n=1 Tax=Halomonas urmiana TaxID=490901 RepID=A0A5R8MLL1_9GAMM|nr:hypothetical protein [Halomonas urmiana]TLF52038.1 hypothetical protein FEI13_05765 [Halomonas urmiana]